MTCPSELRGARFNIPGSFCDVEFFKVNTADCWNLGDYILWKNSTSNIRDPHSLFMRYHEALNDLKQTHKLPRMLHTYISSLKKEHMYTKEQLLSWWSQRHEHNSTKIINNINGSHNIVNSAEKMVMFESQQQQQRQPEQRPLSTRPSSPEPSYQQQPQSPLPQQQQRQLEQHPLSARPLSPEPSYQQQPQSPLPQQQQLDNRGEKRKHMGADGDDLIDNEENSWDSIDRHPRRKSKTDYSVSGLSVPPSGSWVVNGLDVVDYLVRYQNKSKYGANKQKNLSDGRVLSLSYVFIFALDHQSSCTHRLDLSQHVAILDSLNIKQHWTPTFDDAALWCLKLDHQLNSTTTIDTKEAKRTAMKLCMNDYPDDNEGMLKAITAETLLTLVRRFDHWVNNCFLESTFISQHLMPFMSNIFEKDANFTGAVGEYCVSKSGDTNDNGAALLMADYTVFHETKLGQKFDLLVTEVKSIGRSSAGQLQSDLVKLGREMKRMVDSLVDAGVDNAAVGGVLVEGLSCSTYIMDLKFNGVYRMTQLASFHLLRGSSDIMLVPRIIQYFLQLKTILQYTASSIDKRNDDTLDNHENNTSDTSAMSTPKSWKRQASGLPKRL